MRSARHHLTLTACLTPWQDKVQPPDSETWELTLPYTLAPTLSNFVVRNLALQPFVLQHCTNYKRLQPPSWELQLPPNNHVADNPPRPHTENEPMRTTTSTPFTPMTHHYIDDQDNYN